MQMFRKFIALVLVLTFSLSMVSPAFASQATDISEQFLAVANEPAPLGSGSVLPNETAAGDISENIINSTQAKLSAVGNSTVLNLEDYTTEEELRQAIIGDEKWVENFPNGLFNFVGTRFEMNEKQEFLEIAVVRQGGTQGKAAVDFKAIDVSAEYGKDYIIRVYENSQKWAMVKNESAIPLMQTIGDNASINISESVYNTEKPSDEEPAVEVESSAEDENVAETVYANGPAYTDLPESEVTVGEGSTKSAGSLREAREAYLG